MEAFVIIGNGPAGTAVAQALLDSGAHQVTIIGQEHPLPFSRPGLMYYAMGAMRQADLHLDVPQRAKVIEGLVVHWSPEEGWVELADQTRIHFNHLIWAIGAQPRPFKGIVDPSFPVYHLQTMDDASMLRNLKPKRWGVLGGGLVGAELTEWGASRCEDVHWWVREPHLWSALLNPEESQALVKRIESFGVKVHVGAEVKSIGFPVETSRGAFQVDAIGVAIGVESTPIPGGYSLKDLAAFSNVHAVGDVAEVGRRSWAKAALAGKSLGRQLMGQKPLPLPGLHEERTRCFDRSVVLVERNAPATEKSFLDVHGARSIRLGFDEEGRWVKLVAMGWRMRVDRVSALILQGKMAHELPPAEALFNEPEGTALPMKQWKSICSC